MERVMRDMDRWMEGFFNEGVPSLGRSFFPRWATFPAIDMYEEKNHFIIKVEVPGVEKDDINVTVADNALLIRGETKKEETAKEQDYYYSEFRYGGFSRSIPLPAGVKTEEIKATFKNGVLRLEVPKQDEEKEKEIKIEVK